MSDSLRSRPFRPRSTHAAYRRRAELGLDEAEVLLTWQSMQAHAICLGGEVLG